MRKNYTYIAKEPQDRNELIDMVKNKEDVIVLDHNLLENLSKDINENIKFEKKSKKYAIASIAIPVLSSTPLGWILCGLGLILSATEETKNYFKEYNIYQGNDVCLRQILTLHLKESVDLKYDKIIYPHWVGKIEYKKIKHIK